MTQIVPDDILERVNRQQHDVRRRKGIPMRCGCGETQLAVQSNGEKASGTKPALRLAAVSRLKVGSIYSLSVLFFQFFTEHLNKYMNNNNLFSF